MADVATGSASRAPSSVPAQPGEAGGASGEGSALLHDHASDAYGNAGGAILSGAAVPPSSVGPDSRPISGGGSIAAGSGKAKVRVGDRIFAYLATGAGVGVVLLIALVAVFLVAKAIPSLMDNDANFLTSRDWSVDGETLRFGILDLLWVTVLSATGAMLLAVPIAIGIALFITQYAPRRMAKPVAYIIDLLAAIPSIVYGLWGAYVLAPKMTGFRTFLQDTLGWFPLFKATTISTGTIFIGMIVLAVMILPIVTAVAREVFARTPRANIEAALALGATRWEMIRLAVIPYGRPGVVSGAMLGLGRALGETIAVALILSKMGDGSPFSFSVFTGGETFASKIANNAAEFTSPKQTGAYIAAGLVLFLLTFAVNAGARAVVNRKQVS
ncbi:MAG: phosphate transporter permease [Pseudonocardiales bacterium]|nr:phosphate transporter permease [Pseudonocardiales bacterium]